MSLISFQDVRLSAQNRAGQTKPAPPVSLSVNAERSLEGGDKYAVLLENDVATQQEVCRGCLHLLQQEDPECFLDLFLLYTSQKKMV